MMAWFTTTTGGDLEDTLERATHQTLTEFYECYLSGLAGTVIGLLPVQNEGNVVWSERLAAWVTPSIRLTTGGGRLRHATPIT
jgi:hypothetical protein